MFPKPITSPIVQNGQSKLSQHQPEIQ